MTRHKFDANKFLAEVLADAQKFAEQVKKLQKELAEYQQLSVTQRVAYDGLDKIINKTLVDLNKEFEDFEREMESENPVDLQYHLARIRTLSKEGLVHVNKAIDIEKDIKYEGAGIFDWPIQL